MGDYLVSIRFLEQPMSSEASTRNETEDIPPAQIVQKITRNKTSTLN